MPATLDVFKSTGFDCFSLTKAVNKLPYVPDLLGSLPFFEEVPVSTTVIAVESLNGTLSLIQTTPRGAPPTPQSLERRVLRNFNTLHIERMTRIYSDSIQNIRSFGSESDLETMSQIVQRHQTKLRRSVEATLENLRLGCIRGKILDADATELYDMFSEFGVSQLSEVDFALTTATTDVRGKCAGVRRAMAAELGGLAPSARFQIGVICSPEFFDALTSHALVREAYAGWNAAVSLRNDYTYDEFPYAGIRFFDYRGTDDGTTIAVAANKAHFFPIGVPDVFQMAYSPGDFVEAANTLGLPMYSKISFDETWNKYVDLLVQSNPLPICTVPRCLIQAKKA